MDQLDVMVPGDDDAEQPDPWDEALAALINYDGFSELDRRGRTLIEYMDGKIEGFTPAILIARMEADDGGSTDWLAGPEVPSAQPKE